MSLRPQEIQLLELESQTQLLERIQFVSRFNSNFIYISGPEKSGKSTLAQLYLELWSKEPQQGLIIVSNTLIDTQLRSLLLPQLIPNSVFNSEDSLLTSIQRESKNNRQHQLIVIDEAHRLSDKILNELCSLVQYAQNKRDGYDTWQINVLLFGLSGLFATRLTNLSLAQAVFVPEVEIIPLTEEEQRLLAELALENRRNIAERKMSAQQAATRLHEKQNKENQKKQEEQNNQQNVQSALDEDKKGHNTQSASNRNNEQYHKRNRNSNFLSPAHLRNILLISAVVISALLMISRGKKTPALVAPIAIETTVTKVTQPVIVTSTVAHSLSSALPIATNATEPSVIPETKARIDIPASTGTQRNRSSSPLLLNLNPDNLMVASLTNTDNRSSKELNKEQMNKVENDPNRLDFINRSSAQIASENRVLENKDSENRALENKASDNRASDNSGLTDLVSADQAVPLLIKEQNTQAQRLKNALIQQQYLYNQQKQKELNRDISQPVFEQYLSQQKNDQQVTLSSSQSAAVTAMNDRAINAPNNDDNINNTLFKSIPAAFATPMKPNEQTVHAPQSPIYNTTMPIDTASQNIHELQFELSQPQAFEFQAPTMTVAGTTTNTTASMVPLPTVQAGPTAQAVNTNVTNTRSITQNNGSIKATAPTNNSKVSSNQVEREDIDNVMITQSRTSIKAAPKYSYAIQLASVSSLANATNFVHLNQLSNAKIYRSKREANRFVVIMGQYNSLTAASNAIKNLPASLKEQSPWPKSYRAINLELAPTTVQTTTAQTTNSAPP